MRAEGGRSWARVLFIVSTVLVLLAALSLVLASPLALTALDDSDERDWQRLSEIGQTYGAVSALLSALALGAIAGSLVIQNRSAKLDRLQAHRAVHLNLLKMAIDDTDLLACWGLPHDATPDSVARARQRVYCSQVIAWWEMSFEVGAVSEDWLRGSARELFRAEVSRDWWQHVGRRIRTYDRKSTKRLRRILNEEWMLVALGEEAEAAAADDGSGSSEEE